MEDFNSYCNNLNTYSRFKTREVKMGDLGIGGDNPIRIQSMTTTDTMDTSATVAQSIRMIEAGCELVRITAPSIKEAENLRAIKNEIRKAGFNTPLVADIHFTPNAAEVAARIVEKVRINPGNFVDKKKFETIEYTESSYQQELERIRKKFIPLLNICKEYGTAMRIGTNHGSLSDRILSRFGDTPLGMVESAMEFLRIAEEQNYYNLVLSMKASNTRVMIQAYRLLVATMKANGMNYPLHLGVTEAGDGEDGRIKSAVGIGALLEDGLGDTIRVSLTEDPEFEIPVAKNLVKRYENLNDKYLKNNSIENESLKLNFNPFEYKKRETSTLVNIGGENVPRVIVNINTKEKITPANLFSVGYNYSVATDKWTIKDMACDYIYVANKNIDFEIPGTLGVIQDAACCDFKKDRHYPLFNFKEISEATQWHPQLNFIELDCNEELNSDDFIIQLKKIADKHCALILNSNEQSLMQKQRSIINSLINQNIKTPVIIKRRYENVNEEEMQLFAASETGLFFNDGLGDGIWIDSQTSSLQSRISLSFGILQAARCRISKTEYISCPSCGRTLFDLQETTQKIRFVTDHLKGVKIGIMGCIVNGPGEMADADYGYVGTGRGQITLYKGQEVVKRNIPELNAVEALINLIKEHGDWVEK